MLPCELSAIVPNGEFGLSYRHLPWVCEVRTLIAKHINTKHDKINGASK